MAKKTTKKAAKKAVKKAVKSARPASKPSYAKASEGKTKPRPVKKAVNPPTLKLRRARKAAPKKASKRPALRNFKKATPRKASKPSNAKTSEGKPSYAKASEGKAETTMHPKTLTINPYLTFNGNCEEAFNFYKSVFGGKFTYLGRFKEMPESVMGPVPESERELILHVALPISRETILMGSDTSEIFGSLVKPGTNFAISINAINEAQANNLYNRLSQDGQAIMPMGKVFWGSYYGMLTDKFGIQWMISA